MSVEDYLERFNLILKNISDDNKNYQSQNYPQILKEKDIKGELQKSLAISRNGPKACLEFRDFQFKQKKINDKKKNQPKPSESKEIEDFDKFFEDEVSRMYNNTWNKLDKNMKKNRINIFIENFCEENELDIDKRKQFKILIMNEFDKDNLNKKSEVDYDEEKAEIILLNNLIVKKEGEDEELVFSFKEKKKNNKITSTYKSKSELAKVITQTKTLIKKSKEID